MNLIRFLLFMPWYGYLILAAAVGALGYYTQDTVDERIANLEALIAQPAPAPVFLNDYQRPEGRYTEATLVVQLVLEDVVRLVDRTNGVKTGEDLMIPLADPTATNAPTEYVGLMILTEKEADRFDAWATDYIVADGPLGPIMEMTGEVSHTNGEASHASDALEGYGKRTVAREIYFEPYFMPREDVLAAKLKSAQNTSGDFNMIAAVIALFGIGKLLFRQRMKQIRASRAQEAMRTAMAPGADQSVPAQDPVIRSS